MRRGMASSLRLPLTMEHTQIGFLYLVAEQPNAFPAGAVGLVREAAELLTIAIHQSQLYQRLHQSHKEMENLLRAKHEMVQNVSHEVRAPLALLQGYTEILQDGTLGPLTEKQAQAVDILSRKGKELLDVVDRLLTLQTIDRTRLDKASIDLVGMLRQLGREWEFHARRNGMSVEVNVPWQMDPVQADRPLLNQVISNLVDNAVKYSPNGGTICISAYEQNGDVVIAVRDEGQGIAPEALADVFERFFREGSSRSSVKGVGIGLALCKAVVEAHEGRIWAESEGRGKGTTFYVALPS
jgi:signal transduction histidine kinase